MMIEISVHQILIYLFIRCFKKALYRYLAIVCSWEPFRDNQSSSQETFLANIDPGEQLLGEMWVNKFRFCIFVIPLSGKAGWNFPSSFQNSICEPIWCYHLSALSSYKQIWPTELEVEGRRDGSSAPSLINTLAWRGIRLDRHPHTT